MGYRKVLQPCLIQKPSLGPLGSLGKRGQRIPRRTVGPSELLGTMGKTWLPCLAVTGKYVCIYVRMYICMHACMCICVHIHTSISPLKGRDATKDPHHLTNRASQSPASIVAVSVSKSGAPIRADGEPDWLPRVGLHGLVQYWPHRVFYYRHPELDRIWG